MDLSKLPFELLIAVAVMVVSGIKALLDKAQAARNARQWEDEEEDETPWFDPTPQPTQSPRTLTPPSQPSQPAPKTQIPRSIEEFFGNPPATERAETPPAIPQSPIRRVEKPTLSRAEKAALDRIQKRQQQAKRRGSSTQVGKDVLTLPEREFLRLQLRSPRSARNAIALTEVLNPPLALRQGGHLLTDPEL